MSLCNTDEAGCGFGRWMNFWLRTWVWGVGGLGLRGMDARDGGVCGVSVQFGFFYQGSRAMFVRAVSVTGGSVVGVRAVVVMPVSESFPEDGSGPAVVDGRRIRPVRPKSLRDEDGLRPAGVRDSPPRPRSRACASPAARGRGYEPLRRQRRAHESSSLSST